MQCKVRTIGMVRETVSVQVTSEILKCRMTCMHTDCQGIEDRDRLCHCNRNIQTTTTRGQLCEIVWLVMWWMLILGILPIQGLLHTKSGYRLVYQIGGER